MGLHNCSIKELSKDLLHFPLFEKTTPASILKKLDFFSDLEMKVLDEISGSAVISVIPAGTIICRYGKYDERFYVILAGEVSAVIPTEDNPRYELYRLGKGDFFGEELVVSSSPRENSIISTTEVTALSMNAEVLRKLIDTSERISALMDHQYIQRDLRGDLRRVPLLTNLSDGLFNEVLKRVELQSAEKGHVVFREGDAGDAFYLIREGRTDVYRTVQGEKKLIAILGQDQYFGEMSLLSDESRNATVQCLTGCELVKISREDFLGIVEKEGRMMEELNRVFEERKKNREDILKNPHAAMINRSVLDLNKDIYRHLNILSQCVIDTERGGALLATMPGSRYPYVYPRDSACASRFLYNVSTSILKAGDAAFRLLGEISRFILHCQRDDGYWGQRYGMAGDDKGIYKQEDNVAHGVTILCRYLLAARHKGVTIPNPDRFFDAIEKGFSYAKRHFYRNEIHLFYSTTSIHESAIEEGYSIWVNYAYLLMLRLMEMVGETYDVSKRFDEACELKNGFEPTIEKIFTISGRLVRRLKPNGEIDLRPDITLMSPFFFGTGMEREFFIQSEEFLNSIRFIEQTLWDPDLGMLQRYLPFIEDPHTHIHAGNGPWLQYTSMLAQYYYFSGDIEKGNKVLEIVDSYQSKEGYLCEHLTTPERFYEFKRLEWLPGADFEKEFAPDIMVPGITYDLIIEELNHMKNSYDEIERKCTTAGAGGHITFATPLMWSHAEYAMALMLKTERELKNLNSSLHERPGNGNTPS